MNKEQCTRPSNWTGHIFRTVLMRISEVM